MNSCLYECTVMHHRLEPKEHHFRYRIFMFALDLDELDALHRKLPLFSRNRRNLYTFRDHDHVELGAATARGNLEIYLRQHDITLPAGSRITLITLPRILGYIFNPVSFYFCADSAGEPICAVVEVSNTFREMKLYLLREPAQDGSYRLITPKLFYVSPFSDLDLAFDFKLRSPGDLLDIHIDDRVGDRRILLSALAGKRAPLTNGRLIWFTFKYPLLTLKVMFFIHWHALRLWMKKLPFRKKSAQPELQRDVLNPHNSLTGKKP